MSLPIDRDPTIALLQGALDRTSLRSSLVVSNLANVDTPGYRALQVEFAEELGDAGKLTRTNPTTKHLKNLLLKPGVPTNKTLLSACCSAICGERMYGWKRLVFGLLSCGHGLTESESRGFHESKEVTAR